MSPTLPLREDSLSIPEIGLAPKLVWLEFPLRWHEVQANYLDMGNDPLLDHMLGFCAITLIPVRSYLGSKRSAGAR